tara:strand:- start:9741 stop:10079 length:339 start_codon:yes stop_codon:yes gene_type:complete
MESTRQKKISRLIQKELAFIFQHSLDLFSQNIIISINIVRVSVDLASAKVYIGLFPCNNQEKYLQIINKNKKLIRKMLGSNIRNQVRIVPELYFYLDDSAAYADNIDKLLKK